MVKSIRTLKTELNKAIEEKNEKKIKEIYEAIGKEYVELFPCVDSREKEKLKDLFSEIGFNIVLMDVSDYCIYDVGIERKSEDFFDSIFKGDVFNKLIEIKRNFDYSFFIVDRELSKILEEGKKRGIKPNIVFGFIASCMKMGLTPLFLPDDVSLMEIIPRVFEKCYNPRKKGRKYVFKLDKNIKKDILLRFPRMNDWLAKTLLYIFHDDVEKVLDCFYWVETTPLKILFKGVNVEKWIEVLE